MPRCLTKYHKLFHIRSRRILTGWIFIAYLDTTAHLGSFILCVPELPFQILNVQTSALPLIYVLLNLQAMTRSRRGGVQEILRKENKHTVLQSPYLQKEYRL